FLSSAPNLCTSLKKYSSEPNVCRHTTECVYTSRRADCLHRKIPLLEWQILCRLLIGVGRIEVNGNCPFCSATGTPRSPNEYLCARNF
ncbi:8143_t:CDS:2, partial [Ambispora leptoticha]